MNRLDDRLKQFSFQYEHFYAETKAEIEKYQKEIAVKRKTSDYLTSIGPETGRLEVKFLEVLFLFVKNVLLSERHRESENEIDETRNELATNPRRTFPTTKRAERSFESTTIGHRGKSVAN